MTKQTNASPDGAPSGLVVINKHPGATSHDIVNKIRRLYGTKQVGHTGTLDPMARGVLPVLVGRAAKAAEFLTAEDKRYTAKMKLGITTDTEDTSGNIIAVSSILPPRAEVLKCAQTFIGEINQYPPMYSALKVGGQKLVDLARRGITIEREPRKVSIFSLEITPVTDCDPCDEFILDVHCSKGTYIRTLCADIGNALGCGGCMSDLLRTASGGFDIRDSHTIDELSALSTEQRLDLLLPVERLFSDCPDVTLPPFYARLAHSGAEIYQSKISTSFPDGQKIRLCDEKGFFALGEVRDFENGSAIKPIKLFVL